MPGRAATALGAVAAGVAAYGWWEAGWLRRRVIDVEIPGLDPVLEGVRVGHLSDFHLGMPSRGRRSTEQAVAWVAERRPDLVCITGDLVSHPRGEPRLRALLESLDSPFVVLGNHDVAVTRDPFSRRAELADLEASVLLRDAAVTRDVRGRRVSVVGVDPGTFSAGRSRPERLVDPTAALRILLCHLPDAHARLREGTFQLTLAGHLHAGQIVLPLPGRRVTLAHPRATQIQGLYRARAGALHISPGLGTTFVPFRFCARPEVTELVLRAGVDGAVEGHSLISADILARYATDAACEVDGVRGVVDGPRPRHRGVKVTDEAGKVSLELHLAIDWGANVVDVGRSVQSRVADYLGRMADVVPVAVDVVVDEIGPPPSPAG